MSKEEESSQNATEVVCIRDCSHKAVSVATAVDVDGNVLTLNKSRHPQDVDEEGATSRDVIRGF